MIFKNRISWFFLCLGLVGGISCVPTNTSHINPNEKVYLDVKAQMNEDDQSLKVEARFYVRDTSDIRPYFLSEGVYFNGTEMEKKFVDHKGIYYIWSDKNTEKDAFTIAFTNLDEKKYEVTFGLGNTRILDIQEEIPLSDMEGLVLGKNESIVVVDAANKVYEAGNQKKGLDGMGIGEVKIVMVDTRDSLFQLEGKLWVKENIKILSPIYQTEIVAD